MYTSVPSCVHRSGSSLSQAVYRASCVRLIVCAQERRILCLAWSPDGGHLATGSVSTVCLHDTRTGAQLSRIAVGRQADRSDTLVWSVALLRDLTIVTGDSR